MTIKSSGSLALTEIQAEFGGSSPISLSEYYRNGAYVTSNNTGVPTSGMISFNQFYSTVKQFIFTISTNTQEANLQTLATAAGWDGVAPIVANVASGVYLWSDSTSVGGLFIPSSITSPVTIYNSGYIIGRGGDGGGFAGGPALVNQISGVTVINNSGAYIAGGGGGGGSAGGGGAGGGNGASFGGYAGGAGGAIGQAGANGQGGGSAGTPTVGQGGGAGGGGGNYEDSGSSSINYGGGGGGGRILAGVGGSAVCNTGSFGYGGGAGGSGGNAGGIGCNNGTGGGGGWGAAGGKNGGAGGAAISGTSVTLTNNGTIYGAVA